MVLQIDDLYEFELEGEDSNLIHRREDWDRTKTEVVESPERAAMGGELENDGQREREETPLIERRATSMSSLGPVPSPLVLIR